MSGFERVPNGFELRDLPGYVDVDVLKHVCKRNGQTLTWMGLSIKSIYDFIPIAVKHTANAQHPPKQAASWTHYTFNNGKPPFRLYCLYYNTETKDLELNIELETDDGGQSQEFSVKIKTKADIQTTPNKVDFTALDDVMLDVTWGVLT